MLNFNLMPTWFHFASQNRSKIQENVDLKRVPTRHPFSLRFWMPKISFLGVNLEPSWPSVSLQDGPRSLPDVPKRAPRATLELSWHLHSFQDGPRSLWVLPRGLPGPLGGPFLVDFGQIFNRFLVVFWLIFAWFLVVFLVEKGSVCSPVADLRVRLCSCLMFRENLQLILI